jgi:hypothetical protein
VNRITSKITEDIGWEKTEEPPDLGTGSSGGLTRH